ncbi:hypothetical protein EVJ58_g10144 [Rhodofomes roseus]|uniref:Restriction of telomere capping protein 4 n=1 Tax=Rhodofomes roseus TaxID=34475 RepID=A0A4Y9XQ22_9APHY|nr:hypothetical protein EVJ58_g10144 [Rhodofomes roseus]
MSDPPPNDNPQPPSWAALLSHLGSVDLPPTAAAILANRLAALSTGDTTRATRTSTVPIATGSGLLSRPAPTHVQNNVASAPPVVPVVAPVPTSASAAIPASASVSNRTAPTPALATPIVERVGNPPLAIGSNTAPHGGPGVGSTRLTEVPFLPDPQIPFVSKCTKCPAAMGDYRVHSGSAGEYQNRGKIVQTCTNVACSWTTNDATPAYVFKDAEGLLVRTFERRRDPTAYALQLTPEGAVLRLAPPPPPSVLQGRFDCANGCRTAAGKSSQGNHLCVGRLCRACCLRDNEAAHLNQIPRMYCHAHKTKGFEGPSVPQERWRTQLHTPHVQQPAALAQSQPMHAVPLVSTATSHVLPPKHGRNELARPIGPLWEAEFSKKHSEFAVTKATKSKREELVIRDKKTCLFVIFYENTNGPVDDPIEIEEYISTWPQFQLANVPLIVEAFQLTDKSLVVRYEPKQSTWILGRIDTVMTVDASRSGARILIRLPRTVHTEWPVTKRLQDEIQMQSRKRRALTDLVSPVKKMARGGQVSTPEVQLQPFVLGVPSSRQPTTTADNSIAPMPTSLSADSMARTGTPSASSHIAPSRSQLQDVEASSASTNPGAVPTSPEARHQWPSDFYVCDIADGFKEMSRLMLAQSSSTAKGKGLTKAEAFLHVFGLPCVRSTWCRAKALWKAVPEEMRSQYISYSRQKKALWAAFAKEVKQSRRRQQNKSLPSESSDDNEDGLPVNKPEHADVAPALSRGPMTVDHGRSSPSLDDGHCVADTVEERDGVDLQVVKPMDDERAPEVRWPSPLSGAVDGDPSGATADVPELDFTNVDPMPALDGIPELDPAVMKCEFCDEIIPAGFVQSDTLARMREDLEARSWLDPVSWNPRHRRTETWMVHQDYCERHDFEWVLLPQARQAGWPIIVDFASIRRRMLSMLPELRAIVKNPRTSEFFTRLQALWAPGGGMAMQSLAAQLALFELEAESIGYYGHRGYQIILFMLLHLFDESTFNHEQAKPVAYRSMLECVLIPEVAVRFIQQDLSISRMQAVQTLKDSSRYGMVAHPAEPNDPELDAVIEKSTELVKKNISLYNQYLASPTSHRDLDFQSWAKVHANPGQAHVKEEPIDVVLPPAVKQEPDTEAVLGATIRTDDLAFREICENGNVVLELLD